MAKISTYPAASAPNGSEVAPVVQGGVTKKLTATAIAELANAVHTAVSSIDGTETVNLRQGAAVKSATLAAIFAALVTNNAIHSDGSVLNVVVMTKTAYDAIAPGATGTVYITTPEA